MHFYNSVIVSYILFCFEIPYFSIPVYIVYIILLHIFISFEDIVVQHAYNIRAEKTICDWNTYICATTSQALCQQHYFHLCAQYNGTCLYISNW